MSDQNKALYGLIGLARLSEDDREYILTQGRPWLEMIRQQSVLPNVGGAAHELLSMSSAE